MKKFTTHQRSSSGFTAFVFMSAVFLLLIILIVKAMIGGSDKQTFLMVVGAICLLIEFLLIRSIVNMFYRKRIIISNDFIQFKNKQFAWNDIKDVALVVAPNYQINSITIETAQTVWLSKKPILVKSVEIIPKDDDYLVFGVQNQEFRQELQHQLEMENIIPKIVRFTPG